MISIRNPTRNIKFLQSPAISPKASTGVPMLLESSEQTAPPPASSKKRSVEERSTGEAGPASGAAHASSPNTTGGKHPRVLTNAEATSGGGGYNYKTWRGVLWELSDV